MPLCDITEGQTVFLSAEGGGRTVSHCWPAGVCCSAGRPPGGRPGLRRGQVSASHDWELLGVWFFVFVFWKTLFNKRFPLLRTFPLALDVGGGKSHIAEHLSRVEWCHSGGGASFNSSTIVVTLIIGCFRKWWSASSWRTSLRTIWWVSSCEDRQSFPRVLSLDSSLTLIQKLRLSRFNLRVYLLIILFISCEMVWALSCLFFVVVQMPTRLL